MNSRIGQRWLRVVGVVGMGWLMSWQAASADTWAADALRDDRGRVQQWAQPPQRIVSLLPSLTETVCALQACDRIVGRDEHSIWPVDALRQAKVVGAGLTPSIEAIVALQPDVVLLSRAQRLVQQLESLGLRTVVLEPQVQADVQRATQVIAQMLHGAAGANRADAVWQRMQSGMAQAARTMPQSLQGATVYMEVSPGPFVAGQPSFIGELLQGLGLRNVVPAQLGPFPRVSPELVLRSNPDWIILGSHSHAASQSYPGWQRLQAVQQGRVCALNVQEGEVVVRPGPRMDEAAHILARCLSAQANQHDKAVPHAAP